MVKHRETDMGARRDGGDGVWNYKHVYDLYFKYEAKHGDTGQQARMLLQEEKHHLKPTNGNLRAELPSIWAIKGTERKGRQNRKVKHIQKNTQK